MGDDPSPHSTVCDSGAFGIKQKKSFSPSRNHALPTRLRLMKTSDFVSTKANQRHAALVSSQRRQRIVVDKIIEAAS